MGYLLLTGATGLLGSYLVRDLLRAERRLAVLVRSTRLAAARQRTETLMSRWEKQSGHALPRPVVLEGDLTRPGLGLDEAARRWTAENVTSVMHNAASLTFHAETRESEPWRSNLDGTRHVLDFCEAAGIREFHHVSTAYVCGLRQEVVREDELDVGQQHGNDYELSKFEAEKLVRGAEFLDSLTVYRPAIILGDSRSGYSSTFHGFYVPLKLVSTLIKKTAGTAAPREMVVAGVKAAGARLREVLQLDGSEEKNFVPVDWVSAVMARIFTDAALHHRTYHLTPPERTPVRLVQDVMEQVFLEYTERLSTASETRVDWAGFERSFLEGMEVYRSYWRDDPVFDSTNTRAAAADLPCPRVDGAMIRRMCDYAIKTNFGWPRAADAQPDFEVNEHLDRLPVANAMPDETGSVCLGLQVTGSGGGQWQLVLRDGRPVGTQPGIGRDCTATFYMNSRTFEELVKGRSTARTAIGTGRVLIEGNGVPPDELAGVLQTLAAAGGGTS